MTDIITSPEPAVAPTIQNSDPVGTEEKVSLGIKYGVLAEEFSILGQRQIDGNLNPDEMKRKRDLDEMASYGLFIKGQNENLLAEREKIYDAHCKVDLQEGSNPEFLSEEFRQLGKKWIEDGLRPAELERYMHLQTLSKRGVFEQQLKAA